MRLQARYRERSARHCGTGSDSNSTTVLTNCAGGGNPCRQVHLPRWARRVAGRQANRPTLQSTEVSPQQETHITADDPIFRQQVAHEARRDAWKLTNSILYDENEPIVSFAEYVKCSINHEATRSDKHEATCCVNESDITCSIVQDSGCPVINTSQDEFEATRCKVNDTASGGAAQHVLQIMKIANWF